MTEEFVLKGLKLELEPTYGNYDQNIIDTWYSKLKIPLTLMKDITAYCDKPFFKKEDNIKDTETHLKNITKREEYQSIEETMKNNEANSNRLLQQRKFKKLNLKYKSNSTPYGI